MEAAIYLLSLLQAEALTRRYDTDVLDLWDQEIQHAHIVGTEPEPERKGIESERA
jgi:hypothetical protein